MNDDAPDDVTLQKLWEMVRAIKFTPWEEALARLIIVTLRRTADSGAAREVERLGTQLATMETVGGLANTLAALAIALGQRGLITSAEMERASERWAARVAVVDVSTTDPIVRNKALWQALAELIDTPDDKA